MKMFFSRCIVTFLLVAMYACSTEEPQKPSSTESLTTITLTEITTTTAKIGCSQINTSSCVLLSKGIVWNTSPSPTIIHSFIIEGEGCAAFVYDMTDLQPNTKYYVRAFIVNQDGITYGNEVSFTTLATKGTFTDTRDGIVYNWVKIGDQIWMAENLKYLPSVVGPTTGIAPHTNSYYYVSGYDGTNVSAAKAKAEYKIFGVLYNWYAAMDACPSGWHLPSDAEWTQMEKYLANNGYNYDETTGGEREKIAQSLASTYGWNSSSNKGTVGNTDFPTYLNKSGFRALPGGIRSSNGPFTLIHSYGSWWCATEENVTEENTTYAWYRSIRNEYSFVTRDYAFKEAGLSCRCVKD